MADGFKGWIFGSSKGVKGCCRDVWEVSRGILCYVSGAGYCEVVCSRDFLIGLGFCVGNEVTGI